MKRWYDRNPRCDWCYQKKGDYGRFCSNKCKQAHARAYKKYIKNGVTEKSDRERALSESSNATKKEKK